MAAIAAYKAVERALNDLPGVNTDQAGDAINRTVIETAVDERGIAAIGDEEVLRAAIDRETLDGAVDLDALRDGVAETIASDDQ